MDFAYPRPQLQRDQWTSLNGAWRFCYDNDRLLTTPQDIQDWPLQIQVPFPPESRASGIGDTGFHKVCWYERDFDCAPGGGRVILRFGAVDYSAKVWVNGHLAVVHEGGHTPFSADITHLLVEVTLTLGERLLACDRYQIVDGEVDRAISLSDPGIDDFRNELLWSPERPTLLTARVRLLRGGEVLDEFSSYTALRSVAIMRDRFMLNGRPYLLRMVLDQGYWPESLMAAPSDAALRRDVELAKAMGFNGVRKHQKIEDPRYLYWADRLGLLVWEEMPSAYRFTRTAIKRTVREWGEVIERDYSHPCVIVWVPFNESWGVPELTSLGTHRHAVQALYHLTKTLDATRPVIGNDGWESGATDIIGIHDYDNNVDHLRQRYGAEIVAAELFDRRRPGGRVLTLDGFPHRGQPIMLTEFGGIAFQAQAKAKPGAKPIWGYSQAQSQEEFAELYEKLLYTVIHTALFSGFCYTQFADTFQEANGLLNADRSPKIPLERIAAATLTSRTWIPGGV